MTSSLGTRPFCTTWKGSGDTRIIELSLRNLISFSVILREPQVFLRYYMMADDLRKIVEESFI